MIRETLAHLIRDRGREEPERGDVAIHPQSPSYHLPGELPDDGRVQYVSEKVARATLGLDPCSHCQDGDAA